MLAAGRLPQAASGILMAFPLSSFPPSPGPPSSVCEPPRASLASAYSRPHPAACVSPARCSVRYQRRATTASRPLSWLSAVSVSPHPTPKHRVQRLAAAGVPHVPHVLPVPTALAGTRTCRSRRLVPLSGSCPLPPMARNSTRSAPSRAELGIAARLRPGTCDVGRGPGPLANAFFCWPSPSCPGWLPLVPSSPPLPAAASPLPAIPPSHTVRRVLPRSSPRGAVRRPPLRGGPLRSRNPCGSASHRCRRNTLERRSSRTQGRKQPGQPHARAVDGPPRALQPHPWPRQLRPKSPS